MSTVRANYRFARVPEWIILHPNLEALDVRLFALLDRYDGRDCIPKLATLASSLGVSPDTIRRSRQRLEAVGAVVVEARTDPRHNDRQTSNRYFLAGEEPLEAAPSDAIPTRSSPRTGATPSPRTGATPRGSTGATPFHEREQEEPETPPTPPAGGKRARTTRAKHRLPDGWSPDLTFRAWAVDACPAVDLEDELERFRDWALAGAKTYADWSATFRNWMRRRQDEANARSPAPPAPIPASPPDLYAVGPPCETCNGRRFVLPDDATEAIPCPDCRLVS